MPCLAPAALVLVELCKNWSKWRNSRDFVVFLFLDTFEYDKMSRNRWNDKIPWESHLFKGLCSFSCFLTFFVIKRCLETGETPKYLEQAIFFKGYCCFSCFRHFFCNQKCPETGKSLEDYDLFKGFGCFSVTWHFWIQKVSINRRNDKIPWQ